MVDKSADLMDEQMVDLMEHRKAELSAALMGGKKAEMTAAQ